MTALQLAQRLIVKFEAGAAMHSNLLAIIAFLSELTQHAQTQESSSSYTISPLMRSTSDPAEAAGQTRTMFLQLRKAASDGGAHALSQTQTAEANLLKGMQQFTPLTVLRLTSDTDGAIDPLNSSGAPPDDAGIESSEDTENTLTLKEELISLKEYIIRDELNQPGLEVAKYTADGTCEVCFHNLIVAAETPKACGRCDTPVCVDCLYRYVLLCRSIRYLFWLHILQLSVLVVTPASHSPP